MKHLWKNWNIFIYHWYFLLILVMSHEMVKILFECVWVGVHPFKSIIFKASWKVLKSVDTFEQILQKLIETWSISKKLEHFHIPPVLFAHSDTKICNMGSHITGILHLFSSKTPMIHDDMLVRRSIEGVTHNRATHVAFVHLLHSHHWSFRSQPKGRTGFQIAAHTWHFLILVLHAKRMLINSKVNGKGF